MTSSTLKSLQTQVLSLQAKANSLTTHKSQLDKELSDISKKIAILNIPNLDTLYNTLGNGTYKHSSGLSLVIKDKVIITCK